MKKLLGTIAIIIILALVGLGFLYIKYKAFNLPEPAGEVPGTNDGPLVSGNSPFALPVGFELSVFAEGIKGARVMTTDPSGNLLVSQTSEGKIVALPDVTDADGEADGVFVVVEGLNKPHGMAFRCADVENPTRCTLYVAERDMLSSFDYDPKLLKATNKKKLLTLPMSNLDTHYTRTILFLPAPQQDTLLISIGSSCNVCGEKEPWQAKIVSYNVVTKKSEVYAKGLRNSVFMALHPVTGKVWATEMGRDGLGDDIPPDEINIIEKDNNYGWPICYGKNIHDTDFDKNTYIRNPCLAPFETPSHIDLQAHSAPLGIAFIPEEGWPEQYWHNALVAYHGSWNRSVPTGYKIVRIDNEGKVSDFITGWLDKEGKRVGRPVDIKIFPGGTAYITDDQEGLVYILQKK